MFKNSTHASSHVGGVDDSDTEDQAAVVRRLSAEIGRLSRELAKAHRLLSQSATRCRLMAILHKRTQRDAEIIKAKQAAEIERLLTRQGG